MRSTSFLSDEALTLQLDQLVKNERSIQADLLEYLKEFDVRRLYLNLGYPSLFDYLTKHLGYSAGSAQRRIDSCRILRDTPQIKDEIKEGNLNLTQVAMVAK